MQAPQTWGLTFIGLLISPWKNYLMLIGQWILVITNFAADNEYVNTKTNHHVVFQPIITFLSNSLYS